jgi:hypothetical protein
MKMACGRKFGVMAARKEKNRGVWLGGGARMGLGKPWIGGGDKESTLAVPNLFE